MSFSRLSRLLLAALVLVLSACQVDVEIDLNVAQDGSGTVTVNTWFDADADQLLGGVAQQARVGDLERAGWDIATISADDGSTGIIATKAVADRDSWQAVLDELAGPGVFTDVAVTSERSFATASQRLSFELDLREGWDLFSDDEATASLGGQPFGRPLESLTSGRTLDDIVGVNVTAAIASGDDGSPARASYQPAFDATEPLRITLGSTSENATAVLLRWIAIALFSLFVLATLLAVTGIVLQRRSDRLRPAPTPASLASRVPGNTATSTAGSTRREKTESDPVRLVVIEPLSVLYGMSGDDQALLSFVREHGGTARADTIHDGYQSLLVGSTDTASFWELCGIVGDSGALDERYVDSRQLAKSALSFLDEMQRRRIPVAATSNDARRWSQRMRERDRLSVVWPWLVSADCGTVTTDTGMFEILRRESGVAHEHCLYVDADVANLDAARELGLRTAWFRPDRASASVGSDHLAVADLRQLLGDS